jgi:uncharacterized protein
LFPLLLAVFGCDAMSHGGRSAEKVFPEPKVSALIKAAKSGSTQEMEELVRQGADVNYVGQEGITPLVWVMADHNKAAVEKLLKLGADPNKRLDNGNSPTWLAAGRDDPQMLELFLKYHGDPNIIGDRTTALEVAVEESQIKNIDLLVKFGADLNHEDRTGDSAATWAVAMGSFDIAAHLLDLGYSNNLRNLAASVQVRHVPANSEQQRWKDRVIEMLKARGVQYPVLPVKPAHPERNR